MPEVARHGRDENGFTLIELLVVIVIIGILASIAIPVFLGQRSKGNDAEAKSDLRNVANFEEVYFSDFDTYGTIPQIMAAEPRVFASNGVTVTVIHVDGNQGYCLAAKHVASSNTWFYDSRDGGLEPAGSAGCPVTTTGVAGGSLIG